MVFGQKLVKMAKEIFIKPYKLALLAKNKLLKAMYLKDLDNI